MMDCYRTLALLGARRMISRLDRRPWSPTYGCFDREYWHYKTLIEFPRANFQQCVWGLAMLYKTPFDGNEFAGSPAVREWICAALRFWCGMRHRDGSVDEWYKNERSFCATAYTAMGVGETLRLVGNEFDPKFRAEVAQALRRTTDWLVAHPNWAVANQVVAALVALDSVGHPECVGWKSAVIKLQHEEGWFPEYGGADIGYSLLALDLLAHLWKRNRDDQIKMAIDRLIEFLSYFVHPDGTMGGDYGSRGTSHGFVYGLETMAAAGNTTAEQMLSNVRPAVARGAVPTPAISDDTYAAYFYLNSYCLTACLEQLCPERELERPAKSWDLKYFPGAGLVSYQTDKYLAIMSANTTAWRAFGRDGRRYGDSGYVMTLKHGGTCSTGQFEQVVGHSVTSQGQTHAFVCDKSFARVDTNLPLRTWVVPFKLVTDYLLSIPWLSRWFVGFVKRLKITRVQRSDARLRRKFTFTPEKLVVEDELVVPRSVMVRSLQLAHGGAGMHSPSSQFYSPEAIELAHPSENLEAALRSLKSAPSSKICRQINP